MSATDDAARLMLCGHDRPMSPASLLHRPEDAVSTTDLLPWAPNHYGCRVTDIGEDGEYVVSGHVEPRRALAAVLRYLRVDCGIDRGEVDRWWDKPRIVHRWVIPVTADEVGDEDGWLWADDDVRQPLTVVKL